MGTIINFIFTGRKEATLLSQHSKIMSYTESMSTISITLAVLSLTKVQACVRASNSACWTEVAMVKMLPQQHQKELQLYIQHNIYHCHLLNRNHR